MMNFYFLLLLLMSVTAGSQTTDKTEEVLRASCSQSDLSACENLSAYYIKTSNWDNAHLLGEVLCKKDRVMGCTFAGTALLAKDKIKEGTGFLSKACDQFEPYACRSLSRLMKKTRQELMAYMYLKRACHYGLTAVCEDVKKPKTTYSQAGTKFLTAVSEDCSDSQSEACKGHLLKLEGCSAPFTPEDCQLLPGELSIYFRAKLMQSEAKLSLMTVVASEKSFKETSKNKTYSYDLAEVLKDYTPADKYHYVFGFMRACNKKFVKKQSPYETHALYRGSYKELSSRLIRNINAYFSKGKESDCHNPSFGYEAFAVANLDPLNPSRLDIWKINPDSDIIPIQDGLPLP